jgi:hypothetical protein
MIKNDSIIVSKLHDDVTNLTFVGDCLLYFCFVILRSFIPAF